MAATSSACRSDVWAASLPMSSRWSRGTATSLIDASTRSAPHRRERCQLEHAIRADRAGGALHRLADRGRRVVADGGQIAVTQIAAEDALEPRASLES